MGSFRIQRGRLFEVGRDGGRRRPLRDEEGSRPPGGTGSTRPSSGATACRRARVPPHRILIENGSAPADRQYGRIESLAEAEIGQRPADRRPVGWNHGLDEEPVAGTVREVVLGDRLPGGCRSRNASAKRLTAWGSPNGEHVVGLDRDVRGRREEGLPVPVDLEDVDVEVVDDGAGLWRFLHLCVHDAAPVRDGPGLVERLAHGPAHERRVLANDQL